MLRNGRKAQMSAWGQSLPKWNVRVTSAFPLIATEERTSRDVSNVPDSDSCSAANRTCSITSSAERKLSEEVRLHLAYRWFCRFDLDDNVPAAAVRVRRANFTRGLNAPAQIQASPLPVLPETGHPDGLEPWRR